MIFFVNSFLLFLIQILHLKTEVMQEKVEKLKQQIENKEDLQEKIKQLTTKIELDPFSQQNYDEYLQRSMHSERRGDYQSAITDLSKSLCIDPSFEGYVKRGKLYASSEMFYYAFMDFEQAQKLYRQNKEFSMNKNQTKQNLQKEAEKFQQIQRQTVKIPHKINDQAIQFLEHSTAVIKLPQLKKIARDHQKSKAYMPPQFNAEFNKLMTKLIEEKVNAQLQSIKKQQQSYQNLLQLVKQQQQKIQQLQRGLQNRIIDYERIFYQQMDQSIMSDLNKQKCIIYFCTVISEMENYYLSAKVLSQFDEKISFEDYSEKSRLRKQKQTGKQQNVGYSKKIIQKIWKLFEKHESKLQRVGEILKEIPQIGAAFKIIKSSMKVFGWLEEVKLENQCENILATRPSITSFNKLSGKISYQMCKYFKVNITTQKKSQIYKKNCWEKLTKFLQKIKRNQMATRVFNSVKPEQKNYVQQMAKVHTSILMAGIAYGKFKMPNQSQLSGQNWQKQIFEKIASIEESLLSTQVEQQNIIQPKQVEKCQNQKNTQGQRNCILF